jgi:hypothetical protein
LYDKADRAPKAGSLREALFLHVWLKRQEQKVAEMRVLAQGLANAEHVGKAFQDYINTVYPFAKDVTKDSDKKMLEAVEKEVAKGAITFTPIENNILKNAAKKYTMADEDVQKLRSAANKRKGLK